jgi:hypothetical protein
MAILGLVLVYWLSGITQAQRPLLLLPDGNGAWVVRVTTTGGFSGKGVGDYSISSEGKVACSAEIRCFDQIKVSDFQMLVEVIQPGILPIPAPPAAGMCNDCITRTMTISRRDSTGVMSTFTVSWDDTTRSKVPQEMLRIHDAVIALRRD